MLPTKLAKFSELQVPSIPGMVNPADLPTRGFSAVALAESEVWMEGPAFLKDDWSTWPATPPPRENTKKIEHCKRQTTTTTTTTILYFR